MTSQIDLDDTALAVFMRAVKRAPGHPALYYFDHSTSYTELDAQSSALAAGLVSRGFSPGDRLAIFLQNVPHFLIAILACWKAGGAVVPVNPMYKARELALLLEDAEPKAIILSPDLHEPVYSKLASDVHRPSIVLSSSPWHGQQRNDSRVLIGPEMPHPAGTEAVEALIKDNLGKTFTARPARPDDIAFILYTSGTTGKPKGAITTHNAFAVGALIARNEAFEIPEHGGALALAPLFHVTGLIYHVAAAFAVAGPLTLTHRFHPQVVFDAIVERKPYAIAGVITMFVAIMNSPGAKPELFRSVGAIRAGGGSVPPAVVEQFKTMFGCSAKNGYGMTETAGALFMVPLHEEDRIDPESGALSTGPAAPGVTGWIVDEQGRQLPPGEVGEVVVRGPGIARAYWRNPIATQESMQADGFHTGDVGKMDKDGWLYLVDRKKDMIVASGFKVWPREVEDVLYTHPAVREAAVVGVPDPYRGETVKAYVSLKPGASATSDALIEHCKSQMAAYKYPRMLDILEDLPKTASGKIVRMALREESRSPPPRAGQTRS